MLELYKTYNKVKDVFVKPVLCHYFGKWNDDPCLPVWRNGFSFTLTKDIAYYKNQNKKAYSIVNSCQIKVGKKETTLDGKPYSYDIYKTSMHKLPSGLHNRDIVWNSKIRRKLRKLHLSWIKASYQLPMWTAFHVFNHDLFWKTKYEDYRYEFPPQFTIVIFGYSFSWWLKAPKASTDSFSSNDDFYWESILDYLYKYDKDIKKLFTDENLWESNKHLYFACRPEYLKKPYIFINARAEYAVKNNLRVAFTDKYDFEKIKE